jgi:hypothetical protein
MKRTSILLALMLLGALPAFSQSSELGVLVGGSRRFIDGANKEDSVTFDDSTFSLSNNVFELYWGVQIEPDVWIKVKGGRIETPVAVAYTIPTSTKTFRRDVEGEVQHAELNVEYRFSETFGSTGLFAGLGYYRQTAPDSDSESNFGANAGVNAIFPVTRRYGVVVEGTYHWSNAPFQARYMTATAGLRIGF